MEKIKKGYICKIVLIIISSLWLFSVTLYSYDISKSSLRVPLNNDVYRRIPELMPKEDGRTLDSKINITGKVWDRLYYAVYKLEQSIKKLIL